MHDYEVVLERVIRQTAVVLVKATDDYEAEQMAMLTVERYDWADQEVLEDPSFVDAEQVSWEEEEE
jgi:hypothetical protein